MKSTKYLINVKHEIWKITPASLEGMDNDRSEGAANFTEVKKKENARIVALINRGWTINTNWGSGLLLCRTYNTCRFFIEGRTPSQLCLHGNQVRIIYFFYTLTTRIQTKFLSNNDFWLFIYIVGSICNYLQNRPPKFLLLICKLEPELKV